MDFGEVQQILNKCGYPKHRKRWANSGGYFFLVKLIHEISKGDKEYTSLDLNLICNPINISGIS